MNLCIHTHAWCLYTGGKRELRHSKHFKSLFEPVKSLLKSSYVPIGPDAFQNFNSWHGLPCARGENRSSGITDNERGYVSRKTSG